ncbi:MAG: SufE family protein [Chlamydiota bacterium]
MSGSAGAVSCLKKQDALVKLFEECASIEMRYEKIIEMGRALPAYPKEFESQENLVEGCQSVMHLHSWIQEGKIHFLARSEALISAGLAALLIFVYSDEPPEALLTCPPRFLAQLNIPASLSPSRSNGLASLHRKMQSDALKFLSLIH